MTLELALEQLLYWVHIKGRNSVKRTFCFTINRDTNEVCAVGRKQEKYLEEHPVT